jgi:hypothetical protein
MYQFILKENVLTDNILLIAENGKMFKGGYIAIIKEYYFNNGWSDKETIKKFRSLKSLNKYLDTNYKDLDIDFSDTCIKQTI